MRLLRPLLLAAFLVPSCKNEEPKDKPDVNGAEPSVTQAEPHLRRLTRGQYELAVTDLLGEGLVMPTSLEPDTPIEGKLSVGAGTTSVSAWGAERYEDAAYLLAEQAMADDAWVSTNVGCGLSATDLDCAEGMITSLGRRAWRRPLTATEVDRMVGVVDTVALESGDFSLGLTYGLAALLQSPYFVYRVELGQDSPGGRVLTDWEVATRLSFLLWNQPPDDVLLDAVANGELADANGLEGHALRMMDDPRFREGVRALFTDVLELYHLDEITKDPLVFTHASPDLGPAAREETLGLLVDFVVDQDADFRDIMTTRKTFLDQRLAALYEVPAPAAEGFAPTTLPNDGRRRGILGHSSLLSLHAHATSSSSTLRGVFVRQTLLCQSIPPPPAGLNTGIPEPDADSPTLRERMASHREDPGCATCHGVLDPIGLGLENFDGLGRWRTKENGAVIDTSGDLDEKAFDDAWELAARVRNHTDFVPCWAEHLTEVATGHSATKDTEPLIDWYAKEFELAEYRWKDLTLAVVTSDAFRKVGEVIP